MRAFVGLLCCVFLLMFCQQSAGKEYETGIKHEWGRIGVRVSPLSGKISYVYEYCPAREAGLRVGDTVLSADGVKGIKNIDGIAGTRARLVVRMRSGEKVYIEILRVPADEVYDVHLDQHQWTETELTWKQQR